MSLRLSLVAGHEIRSRKTCTEPIGRKKETFFSARSGAHQKRFSRFFFFFHRWSRESIIFSTFYSLSLSRALF
jgi:hypothetical protein